MFPDTITAFPGMTALWQSQLTTWNEFSRMLNESFLAAWRVNLTLGEAILAGRIGPVPPGPVPPGPVPPGPMHAASATEAPQAADGANHVDDAAHVADDEKWRLAERAYLDTAGENMHAEGHVQTAVPETAAPTAPGAAK